MIAHPDGIIGKSAVATYPPVPVSLHPVLRQVFLIVAIIGAAVYPPERVTAQNLVKGLDAGIHFRGTYGATDLSDQGLSPLVQPFIRHQLGWNTQGEFSIGIGTLRGLDYTTRILPLDYRVLYHPFSYQRGFVLPRINPGDVYFYAGAGALNYSIVEIPRPDDPLTVDAGRKIRNSELWNFSENWAFQIPMGMGTAIHLDDDTQLILNAGYHLTSARQLESVRKNGLDGYFTLSFGLKFSRPYRVVRAAYAGPVSLPQIPVPLAAPTAAVPEMVMVLEPMPSMINFDLLKAEIRPDDVRTLQTVLSHLKAKPATILHLRGHTDVRGRSALNEVLGMERAWQTKRWLVAQGISPNRVLISGAGPLEPIADNKTEEGRFRNRRVEFELLNDEQTKVIRDRLVFTTNRGSARVRPVMVEPGQTVMVIHPRPPRMGVELDDVSLSDLDLLADWLQEHAHIRIRIVGHTDSRGSERVNALFSLARASRIQAYLLTKGIPIERMEAVGSGSTRAVASNQTEEGRRQNRRIEIIRLP